MKKCAVYTGSRNIYEDMLMSAKSLIANSDVNQIYFLIEDDIFPYELPETEEVTFTVMNVSNQRFFPFYGPNMATKFTYFAMLRGALPKIFSEYDRILSLDCDTICNRDVSHIWELPIDDYYFAAAIEPARCTGGLMYTNAGVMLQNLKKLRDSKTDEIIDVLNRQRFSWVDQDVMNYLCQGYIYEMNSEYNATEFTKPAQNPRIIHFAGLKQDIWTHHPLAKKYQNMSWTEVFRKREYNLAYPD